MEMNYASFKGKAKNHALNSNAIEVLLAVFSQLNPEWLLISKENMLAESAGEEPAEIAQAVPTSQVSKGPVTLKHTRTENEAAKSLRTAGWSKGRSRSNRTGARNECYHRAGTDRGKGRSRSNRTGARNEWLPQSRDRQRQRTKSLKQNRGEKRMATTKQGQTEAKDEVAQTEQGRETNGYHRAGTDRGKGRSLSNRTGARNEWLPQSRDRQRQRTKSLKQNRGRETNDYHRAGTDRGKGRSLSNRTGARNEWLPQSRDRQRQRTKSLKQNRGEKRMATTEQGQTEAKDEVAKSYKLLAKERT